MPLGAQVLGAWLIAFGVATGLVIRDGDLCRLRVPAVAYTVFGVFESVVLLRYRTQMADDASPWIYGAVLASIVVAGGYGWWAVRRRHEEDPVPPVRRCP